MQILKKLYPVLLVKITRFVFFLFKIFMKVYNRLKNYKSHEDKLFRTKAFISFVIVSALLMGISSTTVNVITIRDRGMIQVFDTHINKLDVFMNSKKLDLRPEDKVDMTWTGKNTGEINVIRAFPVFLTVDGEKIEKWVVDGNISDVLSSNDIAIGSDDTVSLPLDTPLTENLEFKVSRVIYKNVKESVVLPFEIKYNDTITLPAGKIVAMKAGINGTKGNTYKEKYIDGQLSLRTLVSSKTVLQPVSKLVDRGIGKEKIANMKYSQMIKMSACAYSPDGAGMSPYVKFGLKTGYGVVAVDPNVIPLGSRLYIETSDGSVIYGTAVAADTGSAIKGNIIDLCFNTITEARRWGRRFVNVYIIT